MLETAELRAKAYQEYLSSKAAKYAVASERFNKAPERFLEKEPRLKDEELEGLGPRQTLSTIQGHLEEVRNFKERVEAVGRKVLITSELFDQRAGKQLPDVLGLTEVFVGIVERAKPLGEKAKELVQKAEIAYTLALKAEMEATPPLPASLNPVRVLHLQKKSADRIALLKSIYGDEWQDHLKGGRKKVNQVLQQRSDEHMQEYFELVPAPETESGLALMLGDDALEGIEVRVEEDEEGEGEKEIIGELFDAEEYIILAAILIAIKKKDSRFQDIELAQSDVKRLSGNSLINDPAKTMKDRLISMKKAELRGFCQRIRSGLFERLTDFSGSVELRDYLDQEEDPIKQKVLKKFVISNSEIDDLIEIIDNGDIDFHWSSKSDSLHAAYELPQPNVEIAPPIKSITKSKKDLASRIKHASNIKGRNEDLETILIRLFDQVEGKTVPKAIKGQNVTIHFDSIKKTVLNRLVAKAYIKPKRTNDHHQGFDRVDMVKALFISAYGQSLGFNANLCKDLDRAIKEVLQKRVQAKATAEENGEDSLSASESTYFAI